VTFGSAELFCLTDRLRTSLEEQTASDDFERESFNDC
jgi:hypothetical protein